MDNMGNESLSDKLKTRAAPSKVSRAQVALAAGNALGK